MRGLDEFQEEGAESGRWLASRESVGVSMGTIEAPRSCGGGSLFSFGLGDASRRGEGLGVDRCLGHLFHWLHCALEWLWWA